jgi:hypothetical protein
MAGKQYSRHDYIVAQIDVLVPDGPGLFFCGALEPLVSDRQPRAATIFEETMTKPTKKSAATSGRTEIARVAGKCCRCSKSYAEGAKVVGRRFRMHAGCRCR